MPSWISVMPTELNIGDADIAEIARLYRGHIPVLWHVMPNYRGLKSL